MYIIYAYDPESHLVLGYVQTEREAKSLIRMMQARIKEEIKDPPKTRKQMDNDVQKSLICLLGSRGYTWGLGYEQIEHIGAQSLSSTISHADIPNYSQSFPFEDGGFDFLYDLPFGYDR